MYTGRPEGLPWPSTRRRRSGPPHVATQQSSPASAASRQGPIYPTLRANPYPEVTDPFCRIPLSTLFYQLEAVNLGDLLRLSVRPGVKCLLPRIFKGRRGRTGPGRSAELYQPWNPISEQIDFRVTDCKKEKNSFQGPRRRLLVRLRCRLSSTSWRRNFNRLPFR